MPDRDQAAELRDRASDQDAIAAESRDRATEQHDLAADFRDLASERRDRTADIRDAASDDRDAAADLRDTAAELLEAASTVRSPQELILNALNRQHAAADRAFALRDRRAAADDRTHAKFTRETAAADRNAAASGRASAKIDRRTALADRQSAAEDRRHASADGLTGAYLRMPGLVRLAHEMVAAQQEELPLVVAFVDVDGLKRVNDTADHATGDRMLVHVARTLRSSLRPDDLIIRYGGDEFVCVLSGTTIDGAQRRLALLNNALADSAEPASVSFGLAELSPDDSVDELLSRADEALSAARGHGRRMPPS